MAALLLLHHGNTSPGWFLLNSLKFLRSGLSLPRLSIFACSEFVLFLYTILWNFSFSHKYAYYLKQTPHKYHTWHFFLPTQPSYLSLSHPHLGRRVESSGPICYRVHDLDLTDEALSSTCTGSALIKDISVHNVIQHRNLWATFVHSFSWPCPSPSTPFSELLNLVCLLDPSMPLRPWCNWPSVNYRFLIRTVALVS